jgi:hypothetical protein
MKIEEFHDLIDKNKEAYKGAIEDGAEFFGLLFSYEGSSQEGSNKIDVFKVGEQLYADYVVGDSYGDYYNGNYKPWKVEKVVKQVLVDQISYNRI